MDLTLIQGTDRQYFNVRKIFWAMAALEIGLMAMLLFCRVETQILVAGLLLTPVFIALIPLEPTVGLVIMVIVTGLDFLGTIVSNSAAMYYKLSYFHVALVVTLISSVIHAFLQRKETVPSLDIWPPLLVFLTMYIVSLVHTPNITDALFAFGRIVALSGIVLMIVMDVDNVWKTVTITGMMVIVPLGVSILTLYQLFGEGSFYAPVVIKVATELGMPVYRSSGTFMNPNGMACFLMVGSVMSFALLFVKNRFPVVKWTMFAIMAVINVALLASFSRGGWVSTFVAIALIVALHRRWSYFGYFVILLAVCIFAVSVRFPHLWAAVFERVGTIFGGSGDASSSARMALIKTSIWMWMDHPIFGVGLRAFPFYCPDYLDSSMPHILSNVVEAHTIQTEILAEFGLVGLVIATWLFVTLFFSGMRSIRVMKNDLLRCTEIGLVALFLGFIVNFSFATDIANNMFWITIGLIYALPLIDKRISGENDVRETATPALDV